MLLLLLPSLSTVTDDVSFTITVSVAANIAANIAV